MTPEDLTAIPPARLPFPVTRAVASPVETRAEGDGMPTMTGYFSTFGDWYEVDSYLEGHFMESISHRAFDKTISESRNQMKVLYDHGQDPQIGNKVLGSIKELRTDKTGPTYEVPLFDTSYNRDLRPGLEAGEYGSSFRFNVEKDVWDRSPERSDHNPDAIPERTITEARVYEFGPVTFPANPKARAGVRSTTDTFYQRSRDPEQFEALVRSAQAIRTSVSAEAAPPSDEPPDDTREDTPPEPSQPDTPRIEPQPDEPAPPESPPEGGPSDPRSATVTEPQTTMPLELRVARQSEIKSRLNAIANENAGALMPDEVRAEFDGLKAELAAHDAVIKEAEEVRSFLSSLDTSGGAVHNLPKNVRTTEGVPTFHFRPDTRDIYDLADVRARSRTPADEIRLTKENAKRANEVASFPGAKDRSAAQAKVEWLLDNVVEYGYEKGTLARRILNTGRPLYDQAFGKALAGSPLDHDEARALSLAAAAGGNAVTFDLDPTIMGTSTRVVNPIRSLARVIPIVGDEWRGVTSGAITTAFAAEATETTDNAPTLAQPAISTEKAQSFVPFSIEIDMDWAGMRSEMSTLLQESKDDLEATKFTTGTGTNEPFGVITGATTTVNATTGQTTDAEDFYRLTAALPERYQARASILANRAIYNLIRQFVLTGQSNPWKDIDEATVSDGRAGTFMGYPAYMNSAMATSAATGNLFAIVGDFNRYVIVDRVGLQVEILPHLLGVNRRPTGERGLYAFWRVGAKVINADAFRVLIGIA